MTTLETLLRNIFRDKKITDTRLDGFATVSIPKIVLANDAHQYDGILAALNAALPSFHTKVVNVETDISQGKGKTINRKAAITSFQEFVRLEEGTVRKVYVANEAFFLEFYPRMLKDYNKMTKANALVLIKRYSDAATLHAADFPDEFVTAANGFVTTYATALTSQSTIQGKQGIDRTGRNTLRTPLEDALYQGLHTIASYTKGNIDMAKALMDLSSLVPHPRITINHINGVIEKKATINIASDNYDISYVVLLRNIGDTDLNICLAPSATTACGAAEGMLRGGRSKTFVITSLGPLTNNFINLTNLDLNIEGAYEIEIYRQ